MATKKVGPPVPPRPAAVAMSKSRSESPTVQNGKPMMARTVIYKSPSLENTAPAPPKIAEKPALPDTKPPVSVRVAPPVPKPRHKSPARATPTPLQTTTTTTNIEIESNLQTIAFTKKFFNEMSQMCLKSQKKPLPSRPDPEGKERDLKVTDDSTALLTTDKVFSEMLISELAALHPTDNNVKTATIKTESRGSVCSSNDVSPNGTKSRIRTSDWIEVGDNGKEVLMTSCHISLEDSGLEDEEKLDDASSGVGDSWDSVRDTQERLKMSLPGLPPLPKSLSGIEVAQAQTHNLASLDQQQRNSSGGGGGGGGSGLSSSHSRPPATLDTQLAILRREMYGLRQLDLSLLSQLWTLNESIQEFRTMLQEQDALSPPSPTPSNSQSESELPSSEEDELSSDRPIPSRQLSMMPPQHQQQHQQQHHHHLHSPAPTTPSKMASPSMTSSQHQQQLVTGGYLPATTTANRMRIAPPPPPANRKPFQSRPV